MPSPKPAEPKLDPKISVKFNGEDREVFMSFGLLNSLTKVIGDPTRIPAVGVDPELREDVLSELLADRKPSGKISKPIEDIDDIEIPIEDVELLLNWASEHVMGFFLRSLNKAAELQKKHAPAMTALLSSLDGSTNSALKTP